MTSAEPIRLEDVEGLVTVASTEIARTASTLDKHIDALVRKAKRMPPTSSTWLQASVLAIKALILAMRMGRVDEACFALDGLVMLGWGPDLSRLTARIREATKSNVPPREDKLGRCGRQARRPTEKDDSQKSLGRSRVSGIIIYGSRNFSTSEIQLGCAEASRPAPPAEHGLQREARSAIQRARALPLRQAGATYAAIGAQLAFR